jgi:hypothetical protein
MKTAPSSSESTKSASSNWPVIMLDKSSTDWSISLPDYPSKSEEFGLSASAAAILFSWKLGQIFLWVIQSLGSFPVTL